MDGFGSLDEWAHAIEARAKALVKQLKALRSDQDPFAQERLIAEISSAATGIGTDAATPPYAVSKAIDEACVQASASFWSELKELAARRGWEVLGSTDRRLVGRAVFVERLADRTVKIEGVGGSTTPHAPGVVARLDPLFEVLQKGSMSNDDFLRLLLQAYKEANTTAAVPLEQAFRHTVLLSQSKTFWSSDQRRFTPLPRYAFRYRISKALEEVAGVVDGYQMRLSPTVDRKHFWEIYSPVEGRVVQVGRLTFSEMGGV